MPIPEPTKNVKGFKLPFPARRRYAGMILDEIVAATPAGKDGNFVQSLHAAKDRLSKKQVDYVIGVQENPAKAPNGTSSIAARYTNVWQTPDEKFQKYWAAADPKKPYTPVDPKPKNVPNAVPVIDGELLKQVSEEVTADVVMAGTLPEVLKKIIAKMPIEVIETILNEVYDRYEHDLEAFEKNEVAMYMRGVYFGKSEGGS